MNKISLFLIILIPLVISGCGDYYIDQFILSDGSMIYKKTYDFESYIEKVREEYPENYEESEEVYSLDESHESGLCDDVLEEKRYDNNYIYYWCEFKDYQLNIYAHLKKGFIPIEQDGNSYEYELVHFMNYFDIGGYDASEQGEVSFTIFFEGKVISSDVGLIEGNKVIFNVFDLFQSFKNNENPKIKARIQKKSEPQKKLSIVKFNFDGTYAVINTFYQFIDLEATKLIWDLNESEIEKLMCKKVSDFEYSLVYDNFKNMSCELKNNEIIYALEFNKNNVTHLVNDNYKYDIKDLIFLEELDMEEFIELMDIHKEYEFIVEDYEVHYVFEGVVLIADVGKKDKNKVIIKYDDLNKIKEDSKIIVSSKKIKPVDWKTYSIILLSVIIIGIIISLVFFKKKNIKNKEELNNQNNLNQNLN